MLWFVLTAGQLSAQTIYEYSSSDATMYFFDKSLSQYIPHITRQYQNARYLHSDLWHLPLADGDDKIQPPMMLITDWEDDGNGGASAIPANIISIGMAPLNFSYNISPSTERYHHLFTHEYTHTVMTDHAARRDRMWRRFTGGKFVVDDAHPFSALWSYLGAPRWYAPRWYHEGIACFMETWMGGGVGRALGGYDEMYFRSLVNEGKTLYSVVGLETEGTVSDFQVGTNSYLYGTRFVNYLTLTHGLDSLLRFYNRTDDSRKFFNRQFEHVYGTSLRKEWDNWTTHEQRHQQEQIAKIKEYPLTPLDTLTEQSLGSVSPPLYDEHRQRLYYAANYLGELAHLEEYDLTTGTRRKLHTIEAPMLYQTAYVALDTLRQRLIYTTQNGQMRGLRVLDLQSRRITKKLKYQRVAEVVYDNQRDCLYGIMTNGGVCYLVHYDSQLNERTVLYPFNFGLSVFDLAVSHDGRYLSATISEKDGQHTLIRFDTDQLDKANLTFERVFTLPDSNLGQFRFAPGDSTLIGSSYYTGVSNIWQLNLRTKQFDLLSNTDIGLFSPLCYGADSLIALQFGSDGMYPVRMPRRVLHDANAIALLGQQAYERHAKELESIGTHTTPVPPIAYSDVYDSINVYHPLQRLRFIGAFPEISGFTDKQAWNKMTPVVGYRLILSDPLGLHTLNLSLGISPWSNHRTKQQLHADLQWKYMGWTVKAAWNHTSFYDLFGPFRSSRKGWQMVGGYERQHTLSSPYQSTWGFSVSIYGDMDALPLFQNVEIDEGIHSFQTASAYWQAEKTYKSLGAIMPEQGWTFSANAYAYMANKRLFPLIDIEASHGWLLPWRNSSVWVRGYAGQSLGDQHTAFGNSYFGGFRNNYIDNQRTHRYRDASAMPGAEIDEISAHNYGKCLVELNLRPYHFNNVGSMNFYPTTAYASAFTSVLVTNPYHLQLYDHGEGIPSCSAYTNVGTQLNCELVLFKYLKTTWSVGYARIFMPDKTNKGQWMCSLKLL